MAVGVRGSGLRLTARRPHATHSLTHSLTHSQSVNDNDDDDDKRTTTTNERRQTNDERRRLSCLSSAHSSRTHAETNTVSKIDCLTDHADEVATARIAFDEKTRFLCMCVCVRGVARNGAH